MIELSFRPTVINGNRYADNFVAWRRSPVWAARLTKAKPASLNAPFSDGRKQAVSPIEYEL